MKFGTCPPGNAASHNEWGCFFPHHNKLYCTERTDLITNMSFYRELSGYLEGKYINITGNKYLCVKNVDNC